MSIHDIVSVDKEDDCRYEEGTNQALGDTIDIRNLLCEANQPQKSEEENRPKGRAKRAH